MKKILALLLVIVTVFSFSACGGEDGEKNSSVIEFEGSKAEYIGSELTKDADGNDAILVSFKFTNGNEEAKSYFWSFFNSVKQGDTELEPAITWVDEDSFETHVDSTFVDVEPGKSHKVTLAYNIVDRTTPIVVTFITLTDKVLGEITIDPTTIKEASEGESGELLGAESSGEEGLAGYYVVESMNMEGEILDAEMLSLMGMTESTYVVFREDGTMDLAYAGEMLTFEYVDDGTFFNGFAAGTYEQDGDTVKVVITELGFDATFKRSDGTPPEMPVYQGGDLGEELVAEFAGDWHGLAILYDCKGGYADNEGDQFEVVARFIPDIYGGLYPFILFYANGGEEIENIEFYKQEDYIAVDVYGTFLGEDLYDSEIFIDDYGALYIMLHVDDGNGDVFNVQACLRHLDDEWDSENDFPYPGIEFYNFYKGKSLEEILEIYGLDPSALLEMAENPEETETAVSGEGIVDFETLKEGFIYYLKESHRDNKYRKPSYEEIVEHFGGVEGKKDREDIWSDELHIYRWDTPEGDWVIINFEVDEEGEHAYSVSWSTALNEIRDQYK